MSMATGRRGEWTVSIAAAAVAVVFGIADFSGSFRQVDVLDFGSDTLITISRALAEYDPSIYAGDFLFSSPQNYKFYNNASVWFFYLVEYLGSGDFVTWYRALNILAVSLFLFSWFFLAYRLYRSIVCAAAFAVTCAVAIPVVSGDYWGLFSEPQARQLFSAVLPLIILSALEARPRVLDWIGVFLLMGGAMWLHPASGPPIALALLVAMMASQYEKKQLPLLVLRAFMGGVVFLAFALPNIWQYYVGIREAAVGADPQLVRVAWALRYSSDYTDPVSGVLAAVTRAFGGWRFVLPICAAIGICLLLRQNDTLMRPKVRMIFVFTLAVAFLAGGVPVIEAGIARAAGRTPMQMDLIRCLRYLVPMLLLIAFWSVAHHVRATKAVQVMFSVALAVVWITASQFSPRYRQNENVVAGMKCWIKAQPVCPTEGAKDIQRVLAELSNSKAIPGKIFSPRFGLQIRSYARRELAFDWKDTGWLAYSNHKKLTENLSNMEAYKTIASMPEGPEKHKAWLGFGSRIGADVIVVDTAAEVSEPLFQTMRKFGGLTIYSNPYAH